MDKKGGFGILIFIIFVVLIIAVIFVVILLHGKEEPKMQALPNISMNITYWNITLASNAGANIDYILSNSTDVLVHGRLFPYSIEKFYGVANNTTIVLSAWSSEYYYNFSSCTILSEGQKCFVSLKQKANDYRISLSTDLLTIDPKNLSIQAPIYICFSYGASIANVMMNLSSIAVPADLHATYDLCYIEKNDLKNIIAYPLVIHRNAFVTDSTKFMVLIRDYEISGQKGIGDKDLGLII